MTEKQFKELLKTLKIGNNKSNVEIKELLDAKLNEYLDRQDESAEDMVSDIQDALDYVEELIEKMGGGIALALDESEEAEETEEINRDLLGQAAKNGKKGAAAFTSSADMGGQAGTNVQGTSASAGGVNPKGKPWFYSLYGDQKVEDMFEMAESDLNQGDFKHASSVFDMILKIEVANPGAYMGKVLAAYDLKEPKDIATCYDKGLENQSELKRAESIGNEKQKKFIQDALEERRKAMVYIEADKTLQMRNNPSELLHAATQFDSLGTYRDASQKADRCREEGERLGKEIEAKRLKEQNERERREEERRLKEEKERKEAQRRLRAKNMKRILIAFSSVWGLCAIMNCVAVVGGWSVIPTFFPNVCITNEDWYIYETPSPYFVSLIPMSGLVVYEEAVNLETIIMPFGAKRIKYDKPMKNITIPKQAKSVEINCAELTSLTIPEGVTMLYLYNIPLEWTKLEIPDSIKYLCLEGVSAELVKELDLSSLDGYYLEMLEGSDKKKAPEGIDDIGTFHSRMYRRALQGDFEGTSFWD